MKDHGGTLVNPTQVLGQISLKSECSHNTRSLRSSIPKLHARREFPLPSPNDVSTATCVLSDITRDITADRDRPNKRVHAFSAKSVGHHQESKRVKHNDGGSADAGHLSSLENLLSASVQNSQLLQQLVSQQTPKTAGIGRSWTQQQHRDHNGNANSLYEDSSLCNSRSNEEVQGGSNLRRGTVFEDDGGGRTAQRQQQQSNSVLMNLLVSGCDVSAGYVCLTKQNPRSSKGIASK